MFILCVEIVVVFFLKDKVFKNYDRGEGCKLIGIWVEEVDYDICEVVMVCDG